MRRQFKLTVAAISIIATAIGVFALSAWIAEYHKQSLIAVEMKSLQTKELPPYADFLQPGMTRSAVYQELEKRFVNFEQARDSSRGSNQIILKKRMSSPVFYCSFEDLGVRLIFQPEEGSSPLSSMSKANKMDLHDAPSSDDILRGLDIHGQLMDCL